MSGLLEIFHQDIEEEVTCATFSNDLEILVLGFEDGVVSIYNIVKKRHVADLEPQHSACITALAISPNSKWISVGRATGSLANFLTRTAYLEQVVIGHKSLLHSIQFSADSRFLISSSACGVSMVYSLDEEKPLFQLALARPCLSCSISVDNRVMAVGVTNGTVHTYMWQPTDSELYQRQLQTCRSLERRLKSRAVFRVSSSAATPAMAGVELLSYHGHESPVTSLAFARQSRLLATGGSHDRRVTVVNWDSQEQLAVLVGHESWVALLRWGRADLCLLSCAQHDSVRLWRRDAAGGQFAPTADTTVNLETMCDAMHCCVESADRFVVAGCGVATSSTAAAAVAAAEEAEELLVDDKLDDIPPADDVSEGDSNP